MKKQYIPFVLSAIVFAAGAGILLWWMFSFPSWTLQEQLQIFSPLFLEITFLLMVIAVVVNIRCFKELFAEIPHKVRLGIAAVVIAGLVLVIFVSPRVHRIYYDEDIYENIGQNIAYLKGSNTYQGGTYWGSISGWWKNITGRAGMCNEGRNEYGEYNCFRLEYNKEPNGWAYVLSVVFRLFGVSELAAFLTNNFLFGLSIAVTFLIGYLLFNSLPAGLYAGLILALTPESLRWSNTVAVEPSAACFAALAVCCVLLFLKNRRTETLFLAAVATALGAQFRPESIMIGAVIGILLLLMGSDEFKKGRFYVCAALFFILIIPLLVHLYAVKDVGWGSSGPKFALKYFEGNFKSNVLHYIKNKEFPLLITLFFVAGLLLRNNSEKTRSLLSSVQNKIVLVVWFLLFWGIFIFFYAGSYTYGADVRFALLSYIPVALLAGYGAASLESIASRRINLFAVRTVIACLIIVSFLSFLPFVRAVTQEAWAARADHYYAQKMAKELPDDSVILTHNPNMFLVWGKNAAQASLATEQSGYFNGFFNRYKGGVYFHYNFWCNVPDPLQNSFCKNILERFNSTHIMTFKEKDYTFVLYKVEKKK